MADHNGIAHVLEHRPASWRATLQHDSAQTDHALVAAPAKGSLYLTDFIVSNGATAGSVVLEEDTAGTKTAIVQKLYFAINGGCICNLQTPIKLTAGKDLGFTSVDVTTHTVTVIGFTDL